MTYQWKLFRIQLLALALAVGCLAAGCASLLGDYPVKQMVDPVTQETPNVMHR